VIGFQTSCPKITVELELTMIPRKLTMLNPIGTEISCGKTAAPGELARDAKSGALTTRVAMFEMQDMREMTIVQPRSEPDRVEGCLTIGPTPLALAMDQMKKVIPAMGTQIALAVKRWRLVELGSYC
jgi:hypothetical protein